MPHRDEEVKIRVLEKGMEIVSRSRPVKERPVYVVTQYYHQRLAMSGMMPRTQQEGLPMAKIFQDLSKVGHWLFWNLVEGLNDRTNMKEFKSSELTDVEKQRTTKAFKELHKLGLVKRVKQNHYMISPFAIHPKNSDFNDVAKTWREMK